jgi:hypothetical protein
VRRARRRVPRTESAGPPASGRRSPRCLRGDRLRPRSVEDLDVIAPVTCGGLDNHRFVAVSPGRYPRPQSLRERRYSLAADFFTADPRGDGGSAHVGRDLGRPIGQHVHVLDAQPFGESCVAGIPDLSRRSVDLHVEVLLVALPAGFQRRRERQAHVRMETLAVRDGYPTGGKTPLEHPYVVLVRCEPHGTQLLKLYAQLHCFHPR